MFRSKCRHHGETARSNSRLARLKKFISWFLMHWKAHDALSQTQRVDNWILLTTVCSKRASAIANACMPVTLMGMCCRNPPKLTEIDCGPKLSVCGFPLLLAVVTCGFLFLLAALCAEMWNYHQGRKFGNPRNHACNCAKQKPVPSHLPHHPKCKQLRQTTKEQYQTHCSSISKAATASTQ